VVGRFGGRELWQIDVLVAGAVFDFTAAGVQGGLIAFAAIFVVF